MGAHLHPLVMRPLLSTLALSLVLVLVGCDTMTEATPAALASPAEATETASKSMACAAPTISVNNPPTSNDPYVITVTKGTGNVAASVEEYLNWGNNWVPKKGASFSNSSTFTYTTDWGPPEGPRSTSQASYRARAMCSNGQLSGYSNTITVGIGL